MTKDEITQILHAWNAGEPGALEQLLPLVMDDLRRAASFYLQNERHATRPTSLVNEVCLRFLGQKESQWQNREHFFSVVGRLIRHILIDQARARLTAKRKESITLVSLSGIMNHPEPEQTELSPELLIDVDALLVRLEEIDPQASKIVELRFFIGLTIDEMALTLDISPSTVYRNLAMAKRWLANELGDESPLP